MKVVSCIEVKLFLLAFCAFFSVNGAYAQNSQFEDFWTVEEYFEKHSAQRNLSSAFSQEVQNKVSEAQSSGRVVKIGVVYPGLQASDYWRRSVAALEARLKERNVKYELQTHFTQSTVNVREQSDALGKFLGGGIDYLVFTLNVSRHKRMIENVLQNGRTHLILQNITTPLKAFDGFQPFQYVGFDHAIGTKLLAKRYIETTKGQGRFVVLHGPPGYVTDMRGGTFLREMEKQENMKLMDAYFVGFNRKKAYAAALATLKDHPELDFIFSSSTDIALGVIDALKETGRLGKVMTNGWGGGEAELQSIIQQELDFTVMRLNDDNGVAMADAIYLEEIGRGSEIPLIFSGDMVLVDRSMNSTEIGDLRKRAFRYSK